MKLNEKAIKDYAMHHFINYTVNPFEAFVDGLNKWMKNEGIMLISEQEYACFMELKTQNEAKLRAKEHQEMSKLFKNDAN